MTLTDAQVYLVQEQIILAFRQYRRGWGRGFLWGFVAASVMCVVMGWLAWWMRA